VRGKRGGKAGGAERDGEEGEGIARERKGKERKGKEWNEDFRAKGDKPLLSQ
jgi:hypothetical protein